MRRSILLSAFVMLALAGCDSRQATSNNDDVKRALDQMTGLERDNLAATKDIAGTSRSSVDEIRKLSERVDALAKATSTLLSGQKRGALFLPMEVDTACENDSLCNATARAVCNRINYPNGTPSKFTPGVRPMLNSVVCFD